MKLILNLLAALLLASSHVTGADARLGGAKAGSVAAKLPATPRQGSTLYDPAEPYDANAPVYPQVYSAEQVEEQRRAGIRLVKEFREALAARKTEFHAAPGVYRLPKGSDFGVGTFDAFTLHLPHCKLIMESIERPLFSLWRVKSFEVVGPVVVDFDPLPYSQGRIVASDYEKRRVTVEVAPGFRALVAKADKEELFYAYSPTGIWLPNISWSQFAWNNATLSANGRSVTFSAGQDLQRDYWDRLYSPGNLTTIGPSGPDWLFVLEEVGNLTVRDLDFYGGGFCYRNATETCTLTRVRGRRRPGTNRLCGGGGWQSSTRKCRVTLDSCEFRTSQDDLLDMSSSNMDMVWQKTGPRELVVWSNIWHRYQDDEPGSRFAFYQRDFTPLTSAKLVSAQRVPDAEAKPWIEPAAEFIRTTMKFKDQTGYRAFWRLTFDQDLDLERGTLVEDVADRQMELVMRNCLWSDAGVRVMIQSGKRLELTNNHFVRLAGGLDVVTDSWWWQGATIHNVLIADNVFINCSYGALWGSGRAALSVHNGTPPIAAFPASYPNSDIVIRNNHIDGSSAGAIIVQNSERVQITGNYCRSLFQMKKPQAAIDVAGSANLHISGNTIENCPAPAIRAEWVSGLQCQGNSANNLGAEGKPTVLVELGNVRQANVQDNRAERSQLDAVVRQKSSTEVQAKRNRATDAPTVPSLIAEAKAQL